MSYLYFNLKVHKIFPKRKLASLFGYILWKYGVKQWADKEKTRKVQKVYAAHTNLGKQTNWLCEIPYETGVSPTATLSHWDQASSRKQSECGTHGLSNILKLQATFLYSIYHQRAGKTNFFHMRGGRFDAGNTLCTFNLFYFICLILRETNAHWNYLVIAIVTWHFPLLFFLSLCVLMHRVWAVEFCGT